MGNVVKLPRGGALYAQDEIDMAGRVILAVRSENKKAIENASNFANEEWRKLHLLKRFWYRLNSGIFTPKEWWSFYHISMQKIESRWDSKLLNNVASYTYCADYNAANELLKLRRSERNCYLNPEQISVLEHTRRYFNLVETGEYPDTKSNLEDFRPEGLK